MDDGRCVVREASNRWPVLAERCFHALELDRVRFQDRTGKCAVAVLPAAAACGYQFVIGVRTEAHKAMLENLAPDLIVVLMPWC